MRGTHTASARNVCRTAVSLVPLPLVVYATYYRPVMSRVPWAVTFVAIFATGYAISRYYISRWQANDSLLRYATKLPNTYCALYP